MPFSNIPIHLCNSILTVLYPGHLSTVTELYQFEHSLLYCFVFESVYQGSTLHYQGHLSMAMYDLKHRIVLY